jgi:hypothetical protein
MSRKRSDDNSEQQHERAHIRTLAWLLAAFAVFVYLMYIVYQIVT